MFGSDLSPVPGSPLISSEFSPDESLILFSLGISVLSVRSSAANASVISKAEIMLRINNNAISRLLFFIRIPPEKIFCCLSASAHRSSQCALSVGLHPFSQILSALSLLFQRKYPKGLPDFSLSPI